MKKQIEKLRATMEAAQADEMREAKENDSMVFVPRAEIIKSYFEGYAQALKDVEDNDSACGSDSLQDITHRLDAIVDQAGVEGCLSAYKRARCQTKKILDLVTEFRRRREIEDL